MLLSRVAREVPGRSLDLRETAKEVRKLTMLGFRKRVFLTPGTGEAGALR